MKKTLIVLFSIILFLPSCGNNKKSGSGITSPFASPSEPFTELAAKPNINVYVENSGSMDGYVLGVTEFEQAVYNYLTDIKISEVTDSLNLFYINSKVIPQGSDIEDFIQKLEPSTFKTKGGYRGASDISNVLDTIFKEKQENEIAILVTDGIFSPGSGADATEYLGNQQIGIKSTMAEYLKKQPSTAVIIYQLSSKFTSKKGKTPDKDVCYYNKEDEKFFITEQRPFYIWVIGDFENLSNLSRQIPETKFKGSGVQNTFSITMGNKETNYAVKMGSGKFDLDKKSPKNTIKNLKKDTRGKQNSARFSVNADLSGFLLDESYLRDTSNYDLSSKDFDLAISDAASNPFGYTHQLNFSSENVHKGTISIKLKNQIPQWVEEVNDDDGSIPVEGKTYGLKYQIHGIYEAYTFDKDFYTELKININ